MHRGAGITDNLPGMVNTISLACMSVWSGQTGALSLAVLLVSPRGSDSIFLGTLRATATARTPHTGVHRLSIVRRRERQGVAARGATVAGLSSRSFPKPRTCSDVKN